MVTLLFFVLVSVASLFTAYPACAEIVTLVREYTYEASEADSKISCRTIALEQVKRLLLEELGTYLESESEVGNFQLTKEKIVILTAGIVKVNVLDEKWSGSSYWLKAEVTADTDEVARSINALRQDRQKVKELEETRQLANRLLEEVEKLKGELEATKAVAAAKDQQEYDERIKQLDAIDAFERGYSASLSGNYNDAVASYDRSIQLYPQLTAAYNNRGIAYMNGGNYAQALRDYNTVIMLNPFYAPAYLNRGIVYSSSGNYGMAMLDYNRAIRIDSYYSEAYYRRGNVYSNVGNYRKATDDFSRSLALNPNRPEVYRNRGNAYVRLGNQGGAASDYLRARQLAVRPPFVPQPQRYVSSGSGTYQPRLPLSTGVPGQRAPFAPVLRNPTAIRPVPPANAPVVANPPGRIAYYQAPFQGSPRPVAPGRAMARSYPGPQLSGAPGMSPHTPHYAGPSGHASAPAGRGRSRR